MVKSATKTLLLMLVLGLAIWHAATADAQAGAEATQTVAPLQYQAKP